MDTLTKQEKINMINDRLNIYNMQIQFLNNAILENPNGDHPEKPSRQSMLNDYIARKKAMEDELDKINN